MPIRSSRKRKKNKSDEVQHDFIAIHVDRYEVSVSSGVSSKLVAPEYAIDLDPRDPIFEFETQVQINGTTIEPSDRAGHEFELIVRGVSAPSVGLHLTLQDVHTRDDHGAPKYRSYRKHEIPVYEKVFGIALLNKTRGKTFWSSWINVPPYIASDVLKTLQEDREKFISIHELKEGRNRWVREFSVQTTNPTEE